MLRHYYTSRFGRVVEEDGLNMVSNGLCVSITVRLKLPRASVSTCPFLIQHDRTYSKQMNCIRQPINGRPSFVLKSRKGQRSEGTVALELQGSIRRPFSCCNTSVSVVLRGSQYFHGGRVRPHKVRTVVLNHTTEGAWVPAPLQCRRQCLKI